MQLLSFCVRADYVQGEKLRLLFFFFFPLLNRRKTSCKLAKLQVERRTLYISASILWETDLFPFLILYALSLIVSCTVLMTFFPLVLESHIWLLSQEHAVLCPRTMSQWWIDQRWLGTSCLKEKTVFSETLALHCQSLIGIWRNSSTDGKKLAQFPKQGGRWKGQNASQRNLLFCVSNGRKKWTKSACQTSSC